MKLVARGHTLEITRPLIMGIVNLGEDSFCGDGIPNPQAAANFAHHLIEQGADIIDIGAESARTNRPAISEQEEIDRLCTFIEIFERKNLLSINTWRSSVARAVLALGGDILNDIGGLPTDENARTCAEFGAALVIMHTVGVPKVPHTHVHYDDVIATLDGFFTEKISLARSAGLPLDSIILDPGIDFAKQRDDNLRIYRDLARFTKFHRPILLPVSRKTVIGDVLGLPEPTERDAGTIACLVSGLLRGASILRVHNVVAARRAIAMISAVI